MSKVSAADRFGVLQLIEADYQARTINRETYEVKMRALWNAIANDGGDDVAQEVLRLLRVELRRRQAEALQAMIR